MQPLREHRAMGYRAGGRQVHSPGGLSPAPPRTSPEHRQGTWPCLSCPRAGERELRHYVANAPRRLLMRRLALTLAIVCGVLGVIWAPLAATASLGGNVPVATDMDIGPQLSLRGVPRDTVGLKGEEQGGQNKDTAYATDPSAPLCPPGRVSGCVRRFPLGAQIGVSLVIAGLAWIALWRAFRPFGLLIISRRDVFQGLGAALLGSVLLGLSGYVWMMGG